MEDIPRNLGKEVSRVKLPRPTRRAKPWTLLFVGDSGRVISIKRFKGFLIILCLLLNNVIIILLPVRSIFNFGPLHEGDKPCACYTPTYLKS